MRLLGNEVWLDKGEVVPVFCKCFAIYQPKADSESSRCPECGALNLHREQTVSGVHQEMNQ